MVRRCLTPAKSAFSRAIFVHFGKKRIHFLTSFYTFSVGKMSVVQDYPTRSRLSYTPSYTRSIQYFLCLLHSDVGCVGLFAKVFCGCVARCVRLPSRDGCAAGFHVACNASLSPSLPAQISLCCKILLILRRNRCVSRQNRCNLRRNGRRAVARVPASPATQPIAAVKRPLHFTYSTGFTKCGKNSKVKKQEKSAILYYLFVSSTKIH